VILFVDTEHSSGYEKEWGQRLLAARTRIKYRLEDITGDEVYLIRYDHVTPELVARLEIRALFLSGCSSDLDDYGPGQRDGAHEVIRSLAMPMFGFCAGMQWIGEALGETVERIGRIGDDETDPNPNIAPGWHKEFGYEPVPLTADHPMLEGLGEAPVMRQAHWCELKEVPEGFGVYASTEITPIQLLIHENLPVIGTQFHPEYWTDEHPAGRRMIENFCRIAGLT